MTKAGKGRPSALFREQVASEGGDTMNSAVIAAALDCIVVIDEAGIAMEFNPSAERTFGYRRDEVIGQPIADLIVPPAWQERHRAGMQRYRETGLASVLGRRVEIEGMRAGGEVFPVELTVTEVRQAGERRFMAHLRDLSEAKRAAEELRLQRERLHQVEKLSAMGSLLAGVAHELNNPLAVVVAQSSLLVERALDPVVRDRAERIHAAAERCGRIVKSFLAMARQKHAQREALDLNAIATATLEMLSHGLRSAGVEVTATLDPRLLRVEADRDLIGQVIANLVINAQQALLSRDLPRRLEVATANASNKVVLTVSDNGPGIPGHVASRMFDSYFTTKSSGAGTGIGLSICKAVVEAHGGGLEFRPGEPGGAVFIVTLPAVDGAAAVVASLPAARSKPRRILVIDDEPDVLASIGDMLEALGHQVVVSVSPQQALEIIGRNGIDLIFADLRMPAMSGTDFRRLVAEKHPQLAVRTVIMTGDTIGGAREIATASGAAKVHVLDKPFTLADLRQMVNAVISDDG